MDFGIPKKYIYISLAFFAFNMFVAADTYVPEPNHTTLDKIIYIFLPLGITFLGGSLLGFVVLLFPSGKDIKPEIKYTRSKIIGILIVNMVLVIFSIYRAYTFYLLAANG